MVVFAALVPPALAQTPTVTNGSVYATITPSGITVGNALVERQWETAAFTTASITDKRGGPVSAAAGPDFRLLIGNQEITSDSFAVTSAEATPIEDGLRVTIDLAGPAINATRIVEVYEGIAGFKTQMTLEPLAGMVLRGYTLDEAAVGTGVVPTIHAFRAGADWREEGWGGAQLALGEKHTGTWRESRTAPLGESLKGPAQWISTADGGHSLFMVMERNDWPSSRAAYSSGSESLVVDYSADIILTGPFESDVHAENPQAGESPGRHRVLEPLQSLRLEASFTGFGANPDDEPWQFYKYLSEHRLDPYDNEVTFNSNGTDHDVISTGAKDDMDFATIKQAAPLAKQLGIETFILDDGWQAQSGDWFPDCPGHRDWRSAYDAKFVQRFPDCTFEAVRQEIAPMELGLWMNPMQFHPMAETYRNHPDWSCKAIGDATAAANMVPTGPEPGWDSGSNEAGIGTWGPRVIPHIESRIRTAIEQWGVTYFKFDFLVWVDCAEYGDLYDYKEAFIAMLDRLIADHPAVTFEIDETNDYRLFPFESVSRGPSWFQNGSPPPGQLLHNIWNLSPFVPAYSLGQHFLGGNQYNNYPVSTLMAAALPSHLTFFSDIRNLPASVIQQARPWLDFYKTDRDEFAQMTYPLLADPLEQKWTALQTWDPEEGHGALLAFRQKADEATKTIALKNVPAGMTFDLFEAPTGTKVGTATSEQLTAGIEITIPNKDGAQVLVIRPAEQDEFDPATTLTYDGDTQVKIGRSPLLAATLVGSDGPIEGATVAFSFRGRTYEAVTGPDGRATITAAKQTGPPSSYPLVVSYAGSDRYTQSETIASILVGH
jgi:hypothetical protein